MAKAPAERGPLGISLSSYLCPDTDGDTLKAAKVWTLTEVLVREKQQCLEAKSQQKEQLVLLEKKRTTYSQVCGQRPALLPGVWPAACSPLFDPRAPLQLSQGLLLLALACSLSWGFRCCFAASLCCRGFFRSTGCRPSPS